MTTIIDRDIGFYQAEADRHGISLLRCEPDDESKFRTLRQCAVTVRNALQVYRDVLEEAGMYKDTGQ